MTDLQVPMRGIDVGTTKPPASVNPGPAPMLQWLKIADLVVDDRYQRDLKQGNWKAIRRIADSFLWSRFSPVFVAPVEGGKFAVIDGQHRTHAAVLCGFDSVPCQVVQMSLEEQAASFAAVNGLVTKVTSWNILKAAIAAREDWAVQCLDAVSSANCTLMATHISAEDKKPGEVFAIQLVKSFVGKGHAGVVTKVLKGIRASEFGKEAAAYSNEILKPAFYAVADRPWLVQADVDLAKFFDNYDVYSAIDRAAELARTKRRQGVLDISRYDLLSADLGSALDDAFPQRMASAPSSQAA